MATISKIAYSETAKHRRRLKLKDHTLEYYLQREEKAKYKSEYYNGKIVKMAGATYNHNKLATNVLVSLSINIKKLQNKFVALNSDQKVYIPSRNSGLYLGNQFYVFQKFHLYQELPSFCEYIIVSQTGVAIEQWYRKDINSWLKSEMNSPDQHLKIHSLAIEIPISEIYDDVEFE